MLDSLPKTNWFKRSEDIIGDHNEFGDAGIVDLLLHAQDQPFTVDELYDLVEGCGLHVIELIERGRHKYKVESYIRDKQIRPLEICLSNNLAIEVDDPRRAMRDELVVCACNIRADHPNAVLDRSGEV